MDSVDVRVISPMVGEGLQVSAEHTLSMLSARYAARGLVKSVMDCAAEQINKEEETRALAPDAYRLSLLSDAAINGRYRRGKSNMSAADVIGYFSETRARRIQNVDFSGNTGIDVCGEPDLQEKNELKEQKKVVLAVSKRFKAAPQTAGKKLVAAIPTWFNSTKPDSSRETRRFPLSAFAAILAVAMSLMLIVASSVMLTRAESNISQLKLELASASDEVAELKADFETRHDLLDIRRIAMEEYGMVDEDYIRMQYISLKSEDSVEAYEEDREDNVSLSAILSAIGIK